MADDTEPPTTEQPTDKPCRDYTLDDYDNYLIDDWGNNGNLNCQ